MWYVLFIFVVGTTLGVAARAETEVPAPRYQVGDTCTHTRVVGGRSLQSLTQRVTEISEQGFVAEMVNVNGFVIETWSFTQDGNPQSRQDRAGKVFWKPFQPLYRWPMKVNDTWQGSYQYTPQGGGTGEIKVRIAVLAQESVTVPAGTFEALKIEAKGRYTETTSNGSGEGKREELIWYVPSIRCVARLVLSATRWDGTPVQESRELIGFGQK